MNTITVDHLAKQLLDAHLRDEEDDNSLGLYMGEEGAALFAKAKEKYGEDFTKAAGEVVARRLIRDTIENSKGALGRHLSKQENIQAMEQSLKEPTEYIVSDDGTSVTCRTT